MESSVSDQLTSHSQMQEHEDKFAFIWYIWGSYRISHMKIIPIFERWILTYLWSQPFQVRNNQLVCNRLFCKVWRKVKIWRLLSVDENFYHEINVRNEASIHSSLENSNVTLLHITYTANLEDLTASVNHTSWERPACPLHAPFLKNKLVIQQLNMSLSTSMTV